MEGGKNRTGTQSVNTRETVHAYFEGAKESNKDNPSILEKGLYPDSPLRVSVLRKTSGPVGVSHAIEAYTTLYIPEKEAEMEAIFPEHDKAVKQGYTSTATDKYHAISHELETARELVQYLTALHETLMEEKKLAESHIQYKEMTSGVIEKARAERAEIGRKLLKEYLEAKVVTKSMKTVELSEIAKRIGTLVALEDNDSLNSEQQKHLQEGLNRLRQELALLTSEREKQEILLEQLIATRIANDKELAELEGRRFKEAITEELEREISEKKAENQLLDLQIKAIRRAI